MSKGLHYEWPDNFAKKLEEVVDKVEDYSTSSNLNFQETLLEPLSISGGEEVSAQDQRGREILELLQNARDAAKVGDGRDASSSYKTQRPRVGKRAAYIGLTSDGIVVANTGDAFDFSRSKVRNALRILGTSGKEEEDSIGQFGIGLTSIRSAGEVFEVWTKAPEKAGEQSLSPRECWRAVCGPRTLISAIAQFEEGKLDADGQAAYNQFVDNVLGSDRIFGRASQTKWLNQGRPSELLDADDLPYFTYPVALENWLIKDEAEGLRQSRARQLLKGCPDSARGPTTSPRAIEKVLEEVGSFTTAVFIEYEDEAFRRIFTGLTGEEIPPNDDTARRIGEQAWFTEEGSSSVTPELLMNLGGLDYLVVEQLEQVTEHAASGSIQYWNVTNRSRAESEGDTHLLTSDPLIGNGDGDTLSCAELHVELKNEALETIRPYSFWSFEFEDKPTFDGEVYGWYDHDVSEGDEDSSDEDSEHPVHASILLPDDDDERHFRPHLYYPIENAAASFPFCIHADFVVKQTRKGLSGTQFERNCVVVDEVARLVGAVAEVLPTEDDIEIEAATVPWRLLPESLSSNVDWFEEGVDKKSYPELLAEQNANRVGDNEPFVALRAQIYSRLREQQCLSVAPDESAVALDGETATDVLIHGDPKITAIVAALYAIQSQSDVSAPSSLLSDESKEPGFKVPSEATLRSLYSWFLDGNYGGNDELESQLGRVRDDENWNVERRNRLGQYIAGIEQELESSHNPNSIDCWRHLLADWSGAVDGGTAIQDVGTNTAHILLDGVIARLECEEKPDYDGLVIDGSAGSNTKNPYLLPCKEVNQSNGEDDLESTVQLVRIEDTQRQTVGHQGGARSSRQVLRPEREQSPPEIPRETRFNIFVLTEEAFTLYGGKIEKVNWGTRGDEGPADFFLSLLKDASEWGSRLDMQELTFLAECYGDIRDQDRSEELEQLLGGFHSRDNIKKTPYQGPNTPDRIPIRLSARRIPLPSKVLNGDENLEGWETRFTPQTYEQWWQYATRNDGEDSDPVPDEVEHILSETGKIVVSLPDAEIDSNPSKVAAMLGILGTSILPGIRVITLARDQPAHPSRGKGKWNPTLDDSSWESDHERTTALRETLSTEEGLHPYLQLVTTPPFGPGDCSKHSDNCKVANYPRKDTEHSLQTELEGYNVFLASWVWMDSEILNEMSPRYLSPILKYHGDDRVACRVNVGRNMDQGPG